MHCQNIRIRKTAKNTILYYQTLDGVKLAVPTFGTICVLIDFGRACFAHHKESDLLVSSEFASGGSCNGYVPDTRNIDLVRFILSIEDQLKVITDDVKKKEISDFFKTVCTTDTGLDLFEKIAKREHLNHYLDNYPR
jgi:hypothetical protein